MMTAVFEHIFTDDLINYEKRWTGGQNMVQEFPGYAFVALFTIAIMLLLFLDVMKMSLEINRPKQAVTTEIEQTLPSYEKKLIYPFYVDCSRSFDLFPGANEKSMTEGG
jgi:hypothetical protein